MTKKLKRLLSAAIVLLVVVSAVACYAADRDISGRVVDGQGKPLPAVTVIGVHHFSGGGAAARETATDSQGAFELSGVGSVLSFRKAGYQPMTVRLQDTDVTVSVTMGLPENPPWHVPSCSAKEWKKRKYGMFVRFASTKGTKARLTTGADTWDWKISLPRAPRPFLLIWSGPGNCGKDPSLHDLAPDRWIEESLQWQERVMDAPGIDVRGELPNGHRWRYLRSPCDLIQYYDVKPESADVFDRIIDSACVRPEVPRQ